MFVVSVTPGRCSWLSPTLLWEGSLVEVAPRLTASRYMHTSIYLNAWVRVLLSGGWRLGWKQKHMGVLYGGKFLKEKTFTNSEVLWLFAKVFSAKFWHMASFDGTSEQSTRVSRKNLSFYQLSKFFSHKSFPLCGTGNEVARRLYVPFSSSPFLVDLLCLGDSSRQQ